MRILISKLFNKQTAFFQSIEELKLGSFLGVFLPGICSVVGVITFLRFPQIIGLSGAFHFTMLLGIGVLINLLTAFSLSAVVTNLKPKSGGVYTLLSRCFGSELGIAVSLPLYFSQVINIAFCVIGLIEIINPFFPAEMLWGLGISILSILLVMSFLSYRWTILFQSLCLVSLCIAFIYLAFFMNDSIIPSTESGIKKPFWYLFALFFPAITGFESGLFSTDYLKYPKKSIPKGAIGSVLISFLIYVTFSTFLFSKIDRTQLILQEQILLKITSPSWIITQAVVGSTLIYALGCFFNAPQLLKAMAQDALLPKWLWQKIQGKKEKFIATFVTFFLAAIFLTFFDLDLLSPILTHFFLLSYAMLNFACFVESFIQNPSWRPSFSINYIYPCCGFLLTTCVMFLIDPAMTLLSWFLVLLVYFLIKIQKSTQNFDDIRQGIFLYLSRLAAYKLAEFKQMSIQSWRPQVVCFSQNLTYMNPAFEIAHSLTQDKGFLIVASRLSKDIDEDKIWQLERIIKNFFKSNNIDAIIELSAGDSLDRFIEQMVDYYGLGPIKPNTMLFSYDLDKGSFNNFENWMKIIERSKKNGLILCYKQQMEIVELTQFSFYKKIRPKIIEIHIKDETKLEQYFLFTIASLLQKSVKYQHAKVVVVVAYANSKEAIESLKNYYEDFFEEQRFNFDIDIRTESIEKESEKDLVITSYQDFQDQLFFARKQASLRANTLFVLQAEKLAFEQILI